MIDRTTLLSLISSLELRHTIEECELALLQNYSWIETGIREEYPLTFHQLKTWNRIDNYIIIKANETLERETELDQDKYGLIIEPSGKFTERKNSGWCGTPPITYANFDGNWEYSIDSLLNIEVEYWGGMTNYKMEILSIKDDELVVKFIYNN